MFDVEIDKTFRVIQQGTSEGTQEKYKKDGYWHFPIQENVKRVIAKPFSGSHEKMYGHFGCGFHLDVNRALQWLYTEKESRERDVLIYQLEHLEIE